MTAARSVADLPSSPRSNGQGIIHVSTDLSKLPDRPTEAPSTRRRSDSHLAMVITEPPPGAAASSSGDAGDDQDAATAGLEEGALDNDLPAAVSVQERAATAAAAAKAAAARNSANQGAEPAPAPAVSTPAAPSTSSAAPAGVGGGSYAARHLSRSAGPSHPSDPRRQDTGSMSVKVRAIEWNRLTMNRFAAL